MRRNTIQVRDATVDDIDVLIRFACHVRDLPTGRRSGGRPPATPNLRERYDSLLASPTRRVILALDSTSADADDEVVGMAVLAIDVAGELLDIPVIRVSHLVVERAHRRRGAGRALLAAAASYADEMGLEHVSIGAATTDRESNRFFARLGFSPVMVRRVAPLALLRRQLAVSAAETPAGSVRHGRGVRRGLGRSRPLPTAPVTEPKTAPTTPDGSAGTMSQEVSGGPHR